MITPLMMLSIITMGYIKVFGNPEILVLRPAIIILNMLSAIITILLLPVIIRKVFLEQWKFTTAHSLATKLLEILTPLGTDSEYRRKIWHTVHLTTDITW